MTQEREQGVQRVLAMVEAGTVAPAEGERLLQALKGTARTTCPYCAESISAEDNRCAECGSVLRVQPGVAGTQPVAVPSGFRWLSALGKAMVIYLFAVSCLVLLSPIGFSFTGFGSRPPGISGMILALMALAAAVMIVSGKAAGWGVAIAWAALQIVPIFVGGVKLNGQFFHMGIHWTTNNGDGFGLNVWSIVLVCLFVAAKRQNAGRISTRVVAPVGGA